MYNEFKVRESLPCVLRGGEVGVTDVTNWDFSYGDEVRVRCEFDSLFVVELKIPQDRLSWKHQWVSVEIISSEVDEPCCYEGAMVWLDEETMNYIQQMILENGIN